MTKCAMSCAVSRVLQYFFRLPDHVFHREAEVREQLARRGGFSVCGHADDAAVKADILPPL